MEGLQAGSSCAKMGHRYVIDEQGCELFVVNVNICAGRCPSFSFQRPDRGNALAVFAQCCRMLEVQMLNVSISCMDGPREVQVPSATNCSCFDCSRRRRRR